MKNESDEIQGAVMKPDVEQRKAERAAKREARRAKKSALVANWVPSLGGSRKPSCVLHVGTLKTGSTAIQQAIWHNRDRLAEAKFCVPAPLGTQGGKLACLFAKDFQSCRAYRLYFASEDEFYRDKQEKLDRLTRLARQNLNRQFLFSAEQFCQYTDDEIAGLGEWMRERFERVRVVMYLRAPHDYLVSLYSTQLFHGRIEPFYLTKCALDFSVTAKRFAEEFGEDNVVVRPFDQSVLLGGDVVEDFMDVIGGAGIELEAVVDDNPSITGEAQECLRQLNLVFDAHGLDNAKDVLALGLRIFLQENFPGRGFRPARDEVMGFIDRNRDVYENYSRSAGGHDFTVSAGRYPEAGTVLSLKTMQATAGRLMPFLTSKLSSQNPKLYQACHEKLAPWIIRIE